MERGHLTGSLVQTLKFHNETSGDKNVCQPQKKLQARRELRTPRKRMKGKRRKH